MMSMKSSCYCLEESFKRERTKENLLFFIVESEANKTYTTAVFPLEALVMCCIKRERKTYITEDTWNENCC